MGKACGKKTKVNPIDLNLQISGDVNLYHNPTLQGLLQDAYHRNKFRFLTLQYH